MENTSLTLLKRDYTEYYYRAAAPGNDKLLFLQDNDPSQNSAKATEALTTIRAEVVKFPQRPPDLNPIKNFSMM